MTVRLTDIYGNVTVFTGTNATKSGTPPDSITSARVAATSQNPIDYINSSTAASVSVAVETPAGYIGTESLTVTLSDGVHAPVISGALTSGVGVGTLTFTGLNASSLNDGAVTIAVTVVDGAGNGATFAGTS